MNNETFEPEDGLIARLRALGQMPVDSATQSRHLTAMAEAAAAPTLFGTLGNRVRVAVALVVGFMLGTTGLASAGALGPLQPIASTTLEKVGISVPHPDDAGTARYRGEECEDVSYKNRGSYLKAIREKYGKDSAQLEAAKASRCGMPVGSEGDDDGDDVEGTESESGKPDDKGKPESPGKSGEKGNSAEKSGNADNPNKANKGEAADDNAKVSDNAEAECAGGADVAQTAPPSTAPAMPECAEAEKDANTPEDPSADRKPSDESSSDDDDDNEDETQDTTATEQVPSDADTSSDGS